MLARLLHGVRKDQADDFNGFAFLRRPCFLSGC
jgi:hypothetical protein